MENFKKIEDINGNVSMEELGKFIIINDRKSKLTSMVSLNKFANSDFDYKTNLLELTTLDKDYRDYVRAGNCDSEIVYKKRLAVVKKLEELEEILKTI